MTLIRELQAPVAWDVSEEPERIANEQWRAYKAALIGGARWAAHDAALKRRGRTRKARTLRGAPGDWIEPSSYVSREMERGNFLWAVSKFAPHVLESLRRGLDVNEEIKFIESWMKRHRLVVVDPKHDNWIFEVARQTLAVWRSHQAASKYLRFMSVGFADDDPFLEDERVPMPAPVVWDRTRETETSANARWSAYKAMVQKRAIKLGYFKERLKDKDVLERVVRFQVPGTNGKVESYAEISGKAKPTPEELKKIGLSIHRTAKRIGLTVRTPMKGKPKDRKNLPNASSLLLRRLGR